MKLDFSKIKGTSSFEYTPDLTNFFKNLASSVIKEFLGAHSVIKTVKEDEIYSLSFDIDASLIVYSSLTHNPFEYPMHIEEELLYTRNKVFDSENVEFVDSDSLDLDEIVFSLIITNIPLTLHAPNDEYVKTDTYRVMSEDDYLKEKNENFTSPFDALKDIDFDSED